MVDRFFAETHYQGVGPQVGQSQPVVIQADNGKKYFLKTNIVKDNLQDAVFFQELLCSLLAVKLNVPVPSFAIIEIEKDFIENSPSLRFTSKFKEGIYFATEAIEGVENNLLNNYHIARMQGQPRILKSWNSFFKGISNSHQIANIIAFDLFVSNFDRFSNEGNVMIGQTKLGEKSIFAIDHGHCFFGPHFSEGMINKIKGLELNKFDINNHQSLENYLNNHLSLLRSNGGPAGFSLGTIFDGLEQNLRFEEGNPFLGIVQDIESLSEDDIIKELSDIPTEWVSRGDTQKGYYLNYLMRQRFLVRKLLDRLALFDLFSNHLGGVLEWSQLEEQPGTLSLDM